MTDLEISVLGCGTSSGVPVPGQGWGRCDPDEPRNARTRCSLLLRINQKNLLIDTSPDCRNQLLSNKINSLDGVFYTHVHADHTHGIDDIRWINQAVGRGFPCYGRAGDLDLLQQRFSYAFVSALPVAGPFFYPTLCRHDVKDQFTFAGEKITIFDQDHGRTTSCGLRVGDFAYSTDVVALSDHALRCLEGISIWIVDALSFEPHPSHAHVDKVLAWVEKLKVEQVYLTHMGANLDYAHLCQILPKHVRPAYDGLHLSLASHEHSVIR